MKILFFITMNIVWLFLTWPFFPLRLPDIIVGLFVSLSVVLLFGKDSSKIQPKFLNIKRFLWALTYIPTLLYYMVVANFDVLYRVFHPDLPIKPGIVKITTKLKNPIARAILCNSITLTPGTLTIDIIDEVIYVHWINITEKNLKKVTFKIAGRFEKILMKVFE